MTDTRVVVVGSGIAGLTAALRAQELGARVTVVTKASLQESNTRYAQGGIAAVTAAADRVDDHVVDTLVAGAGLSDRDAVRTMAEGGAAAIDRLVARGVPFDRDDDGDLRRGLEAAHSFPRILHAGGDATGAAIERALANRARESGITILEKTFLRDLLMQDGRVRGVVVSTEDGPGHLSADAVVFATGGAGQLFSHTTNPPVATGDGIASALRAGAEVADLEFVQFHPTVLPASGGRPAFLVSEAVRGEGAVLLDSAGHRFLDEEHPDAELAPRDVVARAISRRMALQDGAPIRLDARGLPGVGSDPAETARFLAERFPTIDAEIRARGWDWSRDPVPVTPAAHYLMGGIVTDLDGRTTLPGLYAVGECAHTGVHGANRLASNSLLEGAVFGERVGAAAVSDIDGGAWPVTHLTAEVPVPRRPLHTDADAPPFSRAALQDLMWRHAGLERDARGLGRAAATLAAWNEAVTAPDGDADREDANLLLLATRLVEAARERRDSVGAHFRRDAVGPASSADLDTALPRKVPA